MHRTTVLVITGLLALLATATAARGQHERLSPFDAVRFKDGLPEVRVGETWYEPATIDGRRVADIMEFSAETWPGKAERRFAEDLVEVLTRMGKVPPRFVRLHMRPIDGAAAVTVVVEMTEAKRDAIRDARRGEAAIVTPEQVAEDLEALRRALDDDFAYRHMKGLDIDADPVWAVPEGPVPVYEHATRIEALINRFGDGHAGVLAVTRDPAIRAIPVLFFEGTEGIVATRWGQSDLLMPGYPYLESLDGVPVEEWIDVARPLVTQGSPQLVRLRAIEALREPTRLRRALGLPEGDILRMALLTQDRQNEIHVTVRLGGRRPRYGTWPLADSRILDGNIGYLRITSMDDAAIGRMHQTMWSFRDTDGLVIDVRGNTGGSRGILRSIWGYLMAEDDPPSVANIAKYRSSDRFERDHLENRGLFRADDERWGEAHRAAIARAAEVFEPEWTPNPDDFSAWHYLVLDRTDDIREYAYARPVVVLLDTRCFSATDIFLGAMALHPRIRLVGQPSGGGSARSVTHVLPGSGLRVRLASMASFRPDGRLYDGNGIEVDVEVVPTPGYFIGNEDPALEKAIEIIRAAAAG